VGEGQEPKAPDDVSRDGFLLDSAAGFFLLRRQPNISEMSSFHNQPASICSIFVTNDQENSFFL
jgi:hypothetical protein